MEKLDGRENRTTTLDPSITAQPTPTDDLDPSVKKWVKLVYAEIVSWKAARTI